MAAVPVSLSGVLYDLYNRTTQRVIFIGDASLTGLGVGGGPIIPDQPAQPPGIWGGGNEPFPTPPIWWPGFPNPPGGGQPPTMENPPQPGDPPVAVPPPSGSSGWPVQPITPPPYIIVNYPGVGPIVVAPPATSATTPPPDAGTDPDAPYVDPRASGN